MKQETVNVKTLVFHLISVYTALLISKGYRALSYEEEKY